MQCLPKSVCAELIHNNNNNNNNDDDDGMNMSRNLYAKTKSIRSCGTFQYKQITSSKQEGPI